MVNATKINGIFLSSDNNKMGIFISPTYPLTIKKENEIYDIASKAYEDWMSCENDSEDWAIGDWVVEQLAIAGFKKEEDYYMFYDSDWD